jgi:Hydroxypyruvate isomerase
MPRFAANLSWLYTEVPFDERPALAAADGFEAVECLFPYETLDAPHFHTLLKSCGLPLVLFNAPPGNWTQGERGLACLPQRRAEFRQTLLDIALPYVEATHCPRLHIMAGIPPSETTQQQALDCLLDNLAWACQQTAGTGIGLVIEPINPVDMPGYFLTHQAQAHQIVEQIGAPHLGVQMDLYHCHRVEGCVEELLHHYLPSGAIHHLQIAGYPGRHEPSAGSIPYPKLFAYLDQQRWMGYVGCEYHPETQTRAGLARWKETWHGSSIFHE